MKQARADRTPGGVDPRYEKQEAGTDDMSLGQRVTIHHCRSQQLTDQILRWLLATQLHLLAEIVEHRPGTGGPPLIFTRQTLKQIDRPLGELLLIRFRETQHGGNDPHRNVLGICPCGVSEFLTFQGVE